MELWPWALGLRPLHGSRIADICSMILGLAPNSVVVGLDDQLSLRLRLAGS